MLATLPFLEDTDFPVLIRQQLNTLQVNLGYLCNQQCLHCHVNASPQRTEVMSQTTCEQILAYLKVTSSIKTLDLTGGAPEMNPNFRDVVKAARDMGIHVIDRCNLSILLEQHDLAQFLAQQKVEVMASMPCYLEENVNKQRGTNAFQKSITGLQQLNNVGYGHPDTKLILNLVYNPAGPSLPPAQIGLEKDYKQKLKQYKIEFNQLYTLCNMPIQRFGSMLLSKGEFDGYVQLLKEAHQEKNLETVMCRSLMSVDWQGYVYDCDFNQMLGLPLGYNQPTHISKLMLADLQGKAINIADHCYGCTAGQGSSCGGALC